MDPEPMQQWEAGGCEMMSWPPSWKYDVRYQISDFINQYIEQNRSKCHPNPIWNYGPLSKTSSDMRSVPDEKYARSKHILTAMVKCLPKQFLLQVLVHRSGRRHGDGRQHITMETVDIWTTETNDETLTCKINTAYHKTSNNKRQTLVATQSCYRTKSTSHIHQRPQATGKMARNNNWIKGTLSRLQGSVPVHEAAWFSTPELVTDLMLLLW